MGTLDLCDCCCRVGYPYVIVGVQRLHQAWANRNRQTSQEVVIYKRYPSGYKEATYFLLAIV